MSGIQKQSGRRYPRYRYFVPAQWDFYMGGTGTKLGYVENVSERGCMLRTSESIAPWQWIRLVLRDPARNLWCAIQGRAVRRAGEGRFGIEFTQSLNWIALSRIKEAAQLTTEETEPHLANIES